MLSREELINVLKVAANSGSLLTPKHDPNSGIKLDKFRTVLTQEASASLQSLINSEKYGFDVYFNNRHLKYSYKLLPLDSGSYSTVGFGIQPNSAEQSGSFDAFLVVSGSVDGWHIYSESSDSLKNQIENRQIEFITKI